MIDNPPPKVTLYYSTASPLTMTPFFIFPTSVSSKNSSTAFVNRFDTVQQHGRAEGREVIPIVKAYRKKGAKGSCWIRGLLHLMRQE